MTTPTLGTLQEASLREAWIHEAHSFTPWLADNLNALSSVIGIPLELEGREVAVDQFSADILARNPQTDELILIENQLESTDHSHLGQIMTYLAGLDARVVIWIAAGFRDAHLSAIDWLNQHTDNSFAFFAVEVRVVRIGDSPLAPIFDVLARPNEWDRRLQEVAKERRTSSGLGQFRTDFWSHFLQRHPDHAADGPANGASNRWRTFADLGLVISYYLSRNGVGLFLRGRRNAESADVYTLLEPYADRLADATGALLGAPDEDYHFHLLYEIDVTDRDNWDDMADALHELLTLYTTTLEELSTPHGT